MSVSVTNHERNTFDYFRRVTFRSLQLVSPSKEWVQMALQLSMKEPTVFYAVVALGSIHSALLQIAHHTLTRPEDSHKKSLALYQYCKATDSLQKYIDHAVVRQASVEPVLLCCLLFVSFETFRDKNALALSHLRLGRKIIHKGGASGEMQKCATGTALRPPPNQIREELLSTFNKLENESICFNSPDLALRENDEDSLMQPLASLPAFLASPEHAKVVLDNLVASSLRFRTELLRLAEGCISKTDHASLKLAVRYCMAQCLSRTIKIEPRHTDLHHGLMHGHSAWLIMASRLQDMQHCPVSRALVLMQIQHFFSEFTLRTSRETTESLADHFKDTFERVLDLADYYINGYTRSIHSVHAPSNNHVADSATRATFSLEYSLLPTLYLICLKCRFAALRKRALSLLRRVDRQEGLAWSKGLLFYAEIVVGLEEGRARALLGVASASTELSSDQLPEAARILDVVTEGIRSWEFRIVLSRHQHERGGGIELVEFKGLGPPPAHLEIIKQVVVSIHC